MFVVNKVSVCASANKRIVTFNKIMLKKINIYDLPRQLSRWYILVPTIICCLLFASLHKIVAADITNNYSVHSEEITDITGVKVSIDLAWTLLCGFLVFNMQAGFAFLGAGFLQKKNTLNYLTMSFMDFCVGGLIFWVFGLHLCLEDPF